MRKTSVRNYVHLLIICIPLLLLLIACIFPNKQTTNTYALEETTTTETETTINFNQQLENTRLNNLSTYLCTKNVNGLSIDITITANNSDYPRVYKNNSNYMVVGHKYLTRCTFYSNNSYIPIVTLFDVGNNGQPVQPNIFYSYSNIFEYDSTTQIMFGVIGTSVEIGQVINLSNIEIFDLSQMGLENISTEDFNKLFPLDYYAFNQGQDITLSSLTINNTIGNNAQAPLQSNETKQINTNIIKPINDFYNLSINNWYRDVLNFVGINYDSNNIVKTYIAYQPLWLMWFFLLEIVEIVLTAVPRLLILICKKIGGDEV